MAPDIPLDPRGQLGLGYVQVVAGAGGQSLREFTPVGPFDLDVDPEVPYHRGGLWSAAREPKFSFVEYVVQGPTIEATTYGWTDREGQHLLPQRGSDDPLIRIDPDAIDPDLAFAPLDRFTIRRKPAPVIAAAAAAGTVGRLVTRTSRTLPELDGRVVADPAEDCTRHHH